MKPLTEQQIIKEMISDIKLTSSLLHDESIPVKYRCYASELFVRLNLQLSELLALQGEDCDFENCDRLQEALRQRDNCMGAYEKLKEDPTKGMEEFEVPKIADEPRSPDKFKGGFIKEPTKDIPDDVIEKWVISKYPPIILDSCGENFDANEHFRKCLIKELKAMQSGEIARWAKENET